MAETKICEQCQVEKDIEGFYRRPQKNNPDKRIKICIDCYKQNLAENRRQQEEYQRKWQEEQRQREAAREAERQAEQAAREQWEMWRHARELELSIQANKQCPRCKKAQTNGHLWIMSDGEEHFHFPRFCQACNDATPHKIYRLICPILNQTRYIGITSQTLERRLTGHMRNESGTEQKREWIDALRTQKLRARIEVIDTATNERQAQQAEQDWIDHYIRLGCPLTNSEAKDAQRVLDVQSGRIKVQLHSQEEIPAFYDSSARGLCLESKLDKKIQIARWYNRTQCAYFLDSAYNPNSRFNFNHCSIEAEKYEHAIFEHTLPEKDRNALLCNVTIAYLHWDENKFIWHKEQKYEDIRYLWDKHVPTICTIVEKDGTWVAGFVIGLERNNAPLIHPFGYTVDSARALVQWVSTK